MAVERKLGLVSPVLLTSNGTAGGLVTVSSTKGFVVKAQVILTANTLPTLQLEVKRVLSKTQFLVGEKGKIEQRANISLYTTALNATIYQPEQDRPGIPYEQHERATYEEEPAMAKRVIIVDSFGDKYDESNPFHITNGEGILSGITYDDIQATYPNLTTENYSYYLDAVLVATVQVTYSDSTKAVLTRARRI
jgi:hypothetical protein